MRPSLLRAGQWRTLTLLVLSALANAYVHADYSGDKPTTSGLTRLARDLFHRTSRVTMTDANMLASASLGGSISPATVPTSAGVRADAAY
jgi:hypothetical protein